MCTLFLIRAIHLMRAIWGLLGCRNIEKAKRKPGASKRLNRPSNVNQQSGAFGGQLPVDTPVLAAESESDLDTSWKSP